MLTERPLIWTLRQGESGWERVCSVCQEEASARICMKESAPAARYSSSLASGGLQDHTSTHFFSVSSRKEPNLASS